MTIRRIELLLLAAGLGVMMCGCGEPPSSPETNEAVIAAQKAVARDESLERALAWITEKGKEERVKVATAERELDRLRAEDAPEGEILLASNSLSVARQTLKGIESRIAEARHDEQDQSQ
jgi:hypothetical protein